jgi:hypothetical protein
MTNKKPKSKQVTQDAQFSQADIDALGLNKAMADSGDDDGELVFGSTRPVTLMDGITMDPTGGLTRAGRDFGDDYGNRYYYD